eukprot:TRINITY_DN20520_c2_g1_i1.p1 TRINITY_DN20520_c2_g1~~TRINITY_DN20520_c2_g1_i1.p1  ORF type:complete len:310 (+),score=64.54 TRINITY_DN20520_c2_g1_i1:348-1277(+)
MAFGDENGTPPKGLPGMVHLNVGGMLFTTMRDTLTQRDNESMLAAMFSGRHHVHVDSKSGTIFIDRDGTHFRHILNWLRDGAIPPTDSPAVCIELLREAEYYQLKGLASALASAIERRDMREDDAPELTRKEVIKCVQGAKAQFRGVNLSGEDLSFLDLTKADFSHARVVGTSFSRAELQGAVFKEAQADHANFHNANLKECHFGKANLQEAILTKANLESATFQDASLVGASLDEAVLISAHLQNADLTNASLEGANLEGANLKTAKLAGTNLRNANLQRAYLRDVDLRGTILEGAKMHGANTTGAIR